MWLYISDPMDTHLAIRFQHRMRNKRQDVETLKSFC